MEELNGYVVQVELGRKRLDVSLIASSKGRAISRARMSMVYSNRDMRWMGATYTVVEVVSVEEFKAGRAAGTR